MLSTYVAPTTTIVSKAIVAGMSNVVYATLKTIYDKLQTSADDTNIQSALDDMFIRTDVELLAALLADMTDACISNTSVKVCMNHLHETLQQLNTQLVALDKLVHSTGWSTMPWKSTSKRAGDTATVLACVVNAKKTLDHHFLRLVQLMAIVIT